LKNDWNYEVKLLDRAKFYYLIFRQPFGCRFFDEKIATAQMALFKNIKTGNKIIYYNHQQILDENQVLLL
jgi:hypothetical protein